MNLNPWTPTWTLLLKVKSTVPTTGKSQLISIFCKTKVTYLIDWNDLAPAMIWNRSLPESLQPSGSCSAPLFLRVRASLCHLWWEQRGCKVSDSSSTYNLASFAHFHTFCQALAYTVCEQWTISMLLNLCGKPSPRKLCSSWKRPWPGLGTGTPGLGLQPLCLVALALQHHSDKAPRKPMQEKQNLGADYQ